MMHRKRFFIAWTLVSLIALGFSWSFHLNLLWAASFFALVVILNTVIAWIERRIASAGA